MSHLQQMLNTHPLQRQGSASVSDGIPARALLACIQALRDCAQISTACADACLSEETTHSLKDCIRTNLDCAEMCTTAANALTRRTTAHPRYTKALLETCRLICSLCAQRCENHSQHDHCRICVEACRTAEHACTELLAHLT